MLTAYAWIFRAADGGNDDGEFVPPRPTVVSDHPRPAERSASSDPSAALVVRIRHGDRDAFDLLYIESYPSLVAFAARYVESQAVAEELVQETFLAIWRDRERWNVRTTVREYLFGATRNRAFKVIRHERVKRTAAPRIAQESEHASRRVGAEPDMAFMRSELKSAIETVLNEMPVERRQVLSLRWQEQMAYPEIARILGISVDAAKQQGSRAQRALRGVLERFRE